MRSGGQPLSKTTVFKGPMIHSTGSQYTASSDKPVLPGAPPPPPTPRIVHDQTPEGKARRDVPDDRLHQNLPTLHRP